VRTPKLPNQPLRLFLARLGCFVSGHDFSRAERVGMMRALAPEGFLSLGAQQLGGAENEDGEQGEINSNQHV
jgi:hypothetical protein